MDDLIRQELEQKHGLRFVRRLGRGGFAEVWEAQSSGGVACAVKVSHAPIDDDKADEKEKEAVRKELENLQLVQQISGHPRVLSLMDSWVIAGYLVTRWELAREGTLLDKLREYQQQGQQGIPTEVLLPWMEQAAEGIDFLNSKGIYHRDIKPQNLLLFHDQVKLADLGLVKFAGLSTVGHTGTGTLGYMPPEAYEDHQLSPTVDLYSLAATYVKLRTGQEPFGADPVSCVRNQLEGRPQLDGLPEAEAALLRQALSPEPDRRPRNGCRKWVEKLGQVVLGQVPVQTTGVPENAVTAKLPGDQASPDPPQPVPDEQPTRALDSPGVDTAPVPREPVEQLGHSSSVTCVAFSPDSRYVLTGSEDKIAILWDARTGVILRPFRKHSGRIWSVAFSPDGRFVLTGSGDKTAILWDAETGKKIHSFQEHSCSVNSVAFSPDGRFVLTGSGDKTAILWDAETRKKIRTFKRHSWGITSVAFSPDGRWVLTGSEDRTAILWDAQTGQKLRSFQGHTDWVRSVAFSPDGRWVLTGSSDCSARMWDVANGKQVHSFRGHGGTVYAVAFSPDGRAVLTGSSDKIVRLWNVETGELVCIFRKCKSAVNDVVFSPSGEQVLAGAANGSARLWDIRTGRLLCAFQNSFLPSTIKSVVFQAAKYPLFAGLQGHTVWLWSSKEKQTHTFKGHTGLVVSLTLSSDGKRLLTGSEDNTARIWDIAKRKCSCTFRGHKGTVTSVAFAPHSNYILTGSSDGTARLWCSTGKRIRTFPDFFLGLTTYIFSVPQITSVAFDPEGHSVLTGSTDCKARLWNIATGELLSTFRGHKGSVTVVAFGPDGWILTGSEDNVVRLWDATFSCKQPLRTFEGHEDTIIAGTFSPDGYFVLTGSEDKTAVLWDTQTGQKLRTFRGHTGDVTSVAFSPDGRRVFTGSRDGSARVWDTETGRELLRWWHLEGGRWLAVTPEGYFDGPEEALHLMRHRDPKTGELIPLEESRRYHRPDKVAEALMGR